MNNIEADFSRLEKLIKNLKSNYHVDVGILGQASYADGATIAGVGAVHEFGSIDGNIPERSFIRMPLEQKQAEIEKEAKKKFQELLDKNDIKGIFFILGIACEGAIQDAFDTGGFGAWPALKAATIKRKKGSEAILIDTGELAKSITSEVGQS